MQGLKREEERLGGERVLLTGGSGFLGMAVLSTLLTHAPEFERLVLLLRAGDDAAAQQRLTDEVLGNVAFAALPRDWLLELLDSGRLCAVAGDLADERPPGSWPAIWSEVDTLINCAASVSFEEPLDEALALNAFGPARLLASLRAAGSDPYVVHVSTAYVADCQVEVVHEDGLPHPALATLDAQELLAEAQGWREQIDTGGRRAKWVQARLCERGRGRAASAGWPDTYALTKALGERELLAMTERTTIVRPSIIESALNQPRPGWLHGLKVADPLILAYASRGLTHLPGHATNVIDIVPVDLSPTPASSPPPIRPRAACGRSPSPAAPATRSRSAELAEEIRGSSSPARSPAAGRVADQDRDPEFVDRRVASAPDVGRERIVGWRPGRRWPRRRLLQERKLQPTASPAGRVTRMVKIYGPYTELDCVFDDANARAAGGERQRRRPLRPPLRHRGDRLAPVPRGHPPARGRAARRRAHRRPYSRRRHPGSTSRPPSSNRPQRTIVKFLLWTGEALPAGSVASALRR